MPSTQAYITDERTNEWDAIVVLVAPDYTPESYDTILEIRQRLERTQRNRDVARGLEIRVISIVPGSIIVTLGVIYKTIADYKKFKEGLQELASDAQARLEEITQSQVYFSIIYIAASLLNDPRNWLKRLWSFVYDMWDNIWDSENVFKLCFLVGTLGFIVTMIFVILIYMKIR